MRENCTSGSMRGDWKRGMSAGNGLSTCSREVLPCRRASPLLYRGDPAPTRGVRRLSGLRRGPVRLGGGQQPAGFGSDARRTRRHASAPRNGARRVTHPM